MDKYPILMNESNQDLSLVVRDIVRQRESDKTDFEAIDKPAVRILGELSPTTDTIPVFTSESTAELITLTDQGRNFLTNELFIYDDFTSSGGGGVFALNAVNGGTTADGESFSNHPGVANMTSSATPNSGANARMRLTALLLTGTEKTNCIFKLQTMTNATYRVGFTDSALVADAVDGCYFEINPAGQIIGKTANNSVRSSTAVLTTLVTNTWYQTRVFLNADATLATFEVYSDAGALLGSATLSANIPTAIGRNTGCGFVATESAGATQLLASIDYMDFSQTRKIQRGAFQ